MPCCGREQRVPPFPPSVLKRMGFYPEERINTHSAGHLHPLEHWQQAIYWHACYLFGDTTLHERRGGKVKEEQSKAGAALPHLRSCWAGAGKAGGTECDQRYRSYQNRLVSSIKHSYFNMCKHNSKYSTSASSPLRLSQDFFSCRILLYICPTPDFLASHHKQL